MLLRLASSVKTLYYIIIIYVIFTAFPSDAINVYTTETWAAIYVWYYRGLFIGTPLTFTSIANKQSELIKLNQILPTQKCIMIKQISKAITSIGHRPFAPKMNSFWVQPICKIKKGMFFRQPICAKFTCVNILN